MSNAGRPIPGTVSVEGREFIFIEVRAGDSFSSVLDDEEHFCSDMPLPMSGGAIDERTSAVLPDKRTLIGISYKGDLASWKKRFLACCERSGRAWAVPTHEGLMISDGAFVPFHDCIVRFGA